MSPAEFKSIRQSLGLSVDQIAELLDVRPDYVRHMELPQSKRSSVPVPGKTARLMRAYADGHRPKEWPI